MRLNHRVPKGAFATALLAMLVATARAGDAGRARRDLAAAKDNAETERWDDLDSNMKKAATDMDGLSDAEKAPLQATVAEIKATVTKSVEDDVTKRLTRAAQAEAGMGKLDLERATMRLNSDEAKNYADPAVLEKLRAKIATAGGAPATPETPSTPAIPATPSTPPIPATPITPATPATPSTPATPTIPPVSTAGLSADAQNDLATAKSRLRTAHTMLEGGDPQIAVAQIEQAMRLLKNVPDANKTDLLADIASLNTQIDEFELKARLAEEFRRVDEQVHRFVGDAADSIQDGVVCEYDRINKAQDLLDTNDVKTYMDGDHIKQYQTQLDETRVKMKAHNKTTAIERSANTLKELEDKVGADPFKGVAEQDAYKVFNDLKYLEARVRVEFSQNVDKTDPDVKTVLDRLAAADTKMEASEGKWAIEKMQEQFAASWKITSQPFEGWESESLSATSASQRRVEGLSKTTQTVSGTVYWLKKPTTKATIEKYKDNAVVEQMVHAAQKTLDDASAKLNDAFNSVIAAAEKAPMPRRESDRAEIGYLAQDAAQWFAGTKYKDANVARATALDTKWKEDVARAQKEMEETLKKLTAEASAAWPKIEASASAERGFDPAHIEDWKGKTVLLKGYWNRSGWDFDAAYDFAVGMKGIPVAGNFESKVRDAFAEGAKHTQFGIDDHIGWDLIAVVEGPGQIKRRVNTEWKDAETHELIMKTESYVPEPCVVIKIIGLHAGPVAVGPN